MYLRQNCNRWRRGEERRGAGKAIGWGKAEGRDGRSHTIWLGVGEGERRRWTGWWMAGFVVSCLNASDDNESFFWGVFPLSFSQHVICNAIRKLNNSQLKFLPCTFFLTKSTSRNCTVSFTNNKTCPIKSCSSLVSAGSAVSELLQARQAEMT